jgi:hypothetical protein
MVDDLTAIESEALSYRDPISGGRCRTPRRSAASLASPISSPSVSIVTVALSAAPEIGASAPKVLTCPANSVPAEDQ